MLTNLTQLSMVHHHCLIKAIKYKQVLEYDLLILTILTTSLRWLYCLTINGCNFICNDLLHSTLISCNGSWFTFPFMYIWWYHAWWRHKVLEDILFSFSFFFFFLLKKKKKKNHPSLKFASSISMIISKHLLRITVFVFKLLFFFFLFVFVFVFYQKSEFLSKCLLFFKEPSNWWKDL